MAWNLCLHNCCIVHMVNFQLENFPFSVYRNQSANIFLPHCTHYETIAFVECLLLCVCVSMSEKLIIGVVCDLTWFCFIWQPTCHQYAYAWRNYSGSVTQLATADEWKHWILIYSVFALKNILANEHYSCWCTFVSACRLLLQARLTKDTIKLAHFQLVGFCTQFEELYGAERCIQNLHMACHLVF